jgi:hypothetical protein
MAKQRQDGDTGECYLELSVYRKPREAQLAQISVVAGRLNDRVCFTGLQDQRTAIVALKGA